MRRALKGGFWEKVKSWTITIVIVLLLRAFVVQAYVIPSGSMEDTLLPGDFILATKFDFGIEIPYTGIKLLQFREPERGEVIIFRFPYDGKDFIKRVIGLPGDTIEIIHKRVYINGKLLEEPYVVFKDSIEYFNDIPKEIFNEMWLNLAFAGETRKVRDNFGPIVVPEGHVFVLGDNRDFSYDSRFWGPLPMNLIKAKPLIIYFSWEVKNSFWKFWENVRYWRMFRWLRNI